MIYTCFAPKYFAFYSINYTFAGVKEYKTYCCYELITVR